MSVLEAAKERARQEVVDAVVAEGRRQLGDVGAAALSLRSVARELGMASSAIYRFVASRDELLTRLIVEAYDSLGECVEQSVAGSADEASADRWVSACVAVRQWALNRPHEYSLLYGSPVPDYAAPETTVVPGTRPTLALLQIVTDDNDQAIGDSSTASASEFVADFDTVRRLTDSHLDDRTIMATLNAWTHLFGAVSFELFGQFDGLITDRASFFEASMSTAAAAIGLTRAHESD